ncbi:aldehyde dehydrogenase [Planotetraspora thailandica]|uniref:Aldehyde dehydrogenase n=1 Tax=Planotetraspora thailandica TaxID=487172 RepID=A0A8J3XYJ0_9ACTN|nr:aldehyde dehydrogenase family protein [Planotetraspora thailandica]GII54453.1 aldehyde dehydrogenase [Planotetraspora thailandica]
MTKRYGQWIGGAEVEPASGEYLICREPGRPDVVCETPAGSRDDVDTAVAAAKAAWDGWRARKPIERGRVLAAIAARLRAESAYLAALEAAQAGKPPGLAPLEIEAAATYFEFYAGLVNHPDGEVIDLGPGMHAYTVREPFGVVAIITPWNAPLNQACRGIAPALAVGNTVVAKPSEFTSATTLELARIATQAGLPDGVLNVLTGDAESVGAPLVEHPDVRKVAFTGSVTAGRAIGRVAAERIIPVTLELGGKGPNIIFADADLAAAVRGSIPAFLANAGQICSAGTRLLVHEDVHDQVVNALVAGLATVEPGVAYGSITTEAQFAKVQSYLRIAEEEGAKLTTGGTVLDRPGWYIAPTVFTEVTNDMRIAREEIFGPVLSVIRFADEDEAVAIANDTPYGLSAGLWTRDLSRAHRVAARLEAGQVYVNEWQHGLVEGPFGGYKQSGVGREKGAEALHHYTQTKFVSIRL